MGFRQFLSVFMMMFGLAMIAAAQTPGAQGETSRAGRSNDNDSDGFRRWYRHSGEIHAGRQPDVTGNHVDQCPRGYCELRIAHA